MGTVDIEVDYNWVRGTHDDGNRVHTLSLTVNRRKLKNLRSVVAHVSNVNHWMLSHDNVWAVLHQEHPALKRPSQAEASGRSSFTHDSKYHVNSAGSASQAGRSTPSGPVDASPTGQKGHLHSSQTSDEQSSTSDVQQAKEGSTDLTTVRAKSAVDFVHA